MNLADEYIKYYEEYRKYRDTVKDVIYTKICQIINLFDRHFSDIEHYSLSDDNKTLHVCYEYRIYGSQDYDTEDFPIEWLDKPIDEIKVKIEKIKEERRINYEESVKEAKEREAIERERKERQEYERLKAKFGE
jgi:hypothetical protein